MKKLFLKRESGILLILIVLCLLLGVSSGAFFTATNITNILVNISTLGIMVAGMTLVIITGGIDVSVASQMMVSSILLGYFLKTPLANPVTAILFAVIVGSITGGINGLLISKLRIVPMIVTLGTMSIYRGFILVVTKGKWLMGLPKWFIDIGKAEVFVVPMVVVYTILIFLLTAFIAKYTKFGRSIFAYGGNNEAAIRAGINTQRMIFLCYVFMGALCGFAGLAQNTILGNVQPAGGMGMEMLVIAGVVIGGANILGGSGSLLGSFLGVVLIGVIDNGLVIAHVPTYWQKVVYGLIIMVTVSFDVLQKSKIESRLQKIDIS